MKLKYINQNLDGVEGWIGSDNSFWIRLDFLLEYYLFNNIELSIKFKNEEISFNNYYEKLFKKILENTSTNNTQFNHKEYVKWLNMNNPEVKKVVDLINK